jgi:hypothetical protein
VHDLKSALPLELAVSSHVTQTPFDPVITNALPSPQSHNPASGFQKEFAFAQVHSFLSCTLVLPVNVPAVPQEKQAPLVRTT